MSPAKVIARLRRLAEDWRREEARLCEQFGDVIAPQSMRARQIKDTQAIDAAVEMIERAESDLATAEQDSRQKQARIERMANRLRLILEEPENTMSNSKAMREMLRQARLALEESK